MCQSLEKSHSDLNTCTNPYRGSTGPIRSCVLVDLSLGGWSILRRAGLTNGRWALDRQRHCYGELRGLCTVACRFSIRPDAVSRSPCTSAEYYTRATGADAAARENPRSELVRDDDRKRQYQQHKSQEVELMVNVVKAHKKIFVFF